MTEDLPARVTPAKVPAPPEGKTRIWVDWSGISGVWVCVCGEQGLGGFTPAESRWAVLEHRRLFHPEWPYEPAPWITPTQCVWGETAWGSVRDDLCERDSHAGGLCTTHITLRSKYERFGMCALCEGINAPGQDVCRTHLRLWRDRLPRDKYNAVKEGRFLWTPDEIGRWKGGPLAGQFKGDRLKKQVAKHGVRSGYKAGCRCEACSLAQSTYAAEARRKRLRGGPNE